MATVRCDCGYCGGFGIPGGKCPNCGRRGAKLFICRLAPARKPRSEP